MKSVFAQAEFQVRCEWGYPGLTTLAPISDVVIIVDVLSFSTAIDIAIARGGIIFPYPRSDHAAADFARSVGAELACPDRCRGYSLSPVSLRGLPAGHKLVLPSPNGAALSFACNHPLVFAACLRNAEAVARCTARLGGTVAVIPPGEKWKNGELRPCLEDWLGAGAVIASLPGTRSPEACLAAAAFEHMRDDLPTSLRQCSSGKELVERGFDTDIELAAELNVSHAVPRLIDRAFRSTLCT